MPPPTLNYEEPLFHPRPRVTLQYAGTKIRYSYAESNRFA